MNHWLIFLCFFFLWENIEEAVLMIVNDADSAENRSVRRPRWWEPASRGSSIISPSSQIVQVGLSLLGESVLFQRLSTSGVWTGFELGNLPVLQILRLRWAAAHDATNNDTVAAKSLSCLLGLFLSSKFRNRTSGVVSGLVFFAGSRNIDVHF